MNADEPARATPNNAEQLAATVARIRALAEEYLVAIPTHLVDEALAPSATGQTAAPTIDEQP